MAEAGNQSVIITELFARELEEILLKIFLYLDPRSLKNSRLTCSQWNEFLLRRIWNSSRSRSHLRQRLFRNWKSEEPSRPVYRKVERVHYIVCSEELIILSLEDRGDVLAFSAHSADLLYSVTSCKKNIFDVGIQLDIGPNHVLAVSGAGLVTIFDKHDGSIEYREAPHCSTRMVFGIKMLEARALTGAEDGVIHVFQRNSVNQWRMVGLLSGHEGVTHIDGDENWVCSGTRQSIQIWDLQKLALVETSQKMSVKVWMLSYSFPFVYVVGGEDWRGFKVFNITTGSKLRDIQENKPYHNVQSNGEILTLCEMNDGEAGGLVAVVLYDVKQLADIDILDKDLWQRRMEFQVGRSIFSQVEAVSNKTKMFVSCKRRFSVYDFWKDGSARVIEEDSEEEEEDYEDDLEFESEDNSEEEDVAEVEDDFIDD